MLVRVRLWSLLGWLTVLLWLSLLTSAQEGAEEHLLGSNESTSTNAINGGSHENTTEGTTHGGEEAEGGGIYEDFAVHHETDPGHAVLFPSFCLVIGVMIFYVLSRHIKALPYTAVMFFIGTLMGIGASLLDRDDQLNESIRLWVTINSEVLLLVFLPGLIFKDAFGQNVHLFRLSLLQCFIFAFPLVLAGAALTMLVALYIFPYGWSVNLAFLFGSILSATDPVAVAVLLEEVGAPPRLKVHIAGEALLNDGAAIVFFSIFLQRYLFELGIEGIGEPIDWGKGIALFCRKALGGVANGLLFGGGMLVLLYYLDRRFNREENVVEVTATLGVAYLGFYVAEPVFETSGVLSTLTTGILVKYLGRAMINDPKLLEDFWTLVEQLLNTVLFTLGGVVWGAVIATGEKNGIFTGRDWGYLVVLYIMLHLIRAFLFAVTYPLTVRIGLKTSPQETLFQVYSGLRGAVGIALALALDNEMAEATDGSPEYESFQEQTRLVFAMVGGIAFFTLTINGVTAGPLLRWLGLADSTETRQRIVDAYRVRFRAQHIDNFVHLLTQARFRKVNFALVKHHVPVLADLTREQLVEAVERHKDSTPNESYHPPHLQRVLPYLTDSAADGSDAAIEDALSSLDTVALSRKLRHEERTRNRRRTKSKSTMHFMLKGEPLSALELRLLFISILRSAYERQIEDGELEDREFLSIALEQSLEFAADAVSNGKPLQDWDYVNMVDGPINGLAKRVRKSPFAMRLVEKTMGKTAHVDLKYTLKRLKIERSLAFMRAHNYSQEYFRRELENADAELSEGAKLVIDESKVQVKQAEAVLAKYDPKEVEVVVSHKFCVILLNGGVRYVTKLVRHGLLKDDEAEHFVEEIEHHIEHVLNCNEQDHPGEVKLETAESEAGFLGMDA